MTAWRWAVAALMLASGCRPAPPAVGVDVQTADDDSLTVLENLAADGETETAAELLSELHSGPGEPVKPVPQPRHSRPPDLAWKLTAVDGYRSDLKAVVDGCGVFSFGIRSCGSATVGYLRLLDLGPVRSVHIGHLNVRMGERLVLGRSLGMYPTTSLSAVTDGLAVSPSLSQWFGRTGIDVELRGGAFMAKAVVIGTSNRIDTVEPGALWITVCGHEGHVSGGVTYGEELAVTSESAGVDRPHAPGVLSLHAVYRGGKTACSGELSRYRGAPPFLAFRLSDRCRPLRWKILCFRAPYFSSTTDPRLDLRAPERTNQGVRLDASVVFAGFEPAVSLIAGRLASPSERKSYRRLLLTVSGRSRRPVSWECSFYHVAETRYQYAADGLTSDVEKWRTRETRGRMVLTLNYDSVISHRLRLDYSTRWDGARGVLVSAGSTLAARKLEARWQVSAYSIPQGSRAYVTRPGISSFEFFSAVYGGGSDVSVRLRWRLSQGLTIIVYHGAAWLKESRFYLGLEWRG
jgi:hypothetical protein